MNARELAIAAATRSTHPTEAEATSVAQRLTNVDGYDRAVWFCEGKPARTLSDVSVPTRWICGRWFPRLESSPPGGGYLVRRITRQAVTP